MKANARRRLYRSIFRQRSYLWLAFAAAIVGGCGGANSKSTPSATVLIDVHGSIQLGASEQTTPNLEELAVSDRILDAIVSDFEAAFSGQSAAQIRELLRSNMSVAQSSDDSLVYDLTVGLKPSTLGIAVLQKWIAILETQIQDTSTPAQDDLAVITDLKRQSESKFKQVQDRLDQMISSLGVEAENNPEFQELAREREQLENELQKLIQQIAELDLTGLGNRSTTRLVVLRYNTEVLVTKAEADDYESLRKVCPALPKLKFTIRN